MIQKKKEKQNAAGLDITSKVVGFISLLFLVLLFLFEIFNFSTSWGKDNYLVALQIPKYPKATSWHFEAPGNIVSGRSTHICFFSPDSQKQVFDYYQDIFQKKGLETHIIYPYPDQYPQYKEFCVEDIKTETFISGGDKSTKESNSCNYSIIILTNYSRCH